MDDETTVLNRETLQRVAEAQQGSKPVPGWQAPRIMPPEWRFVRGDDMGSGQYVHRRGLTAIVSCAVELDGAAWVHLSIAHPKRMPFWRELRDAKDLFIGRDVPAYQVLPPRDKYVNIHAYALHCFSPLNGVARLPDFTRGTGSL